MNQGLIPHRYAKALYKLATERGSAQRMYQLMQSLSKAFVSQPALERAVTNPFVSDDDKMRLLVTASGANDKDNGFVDFVKLLIINKRIDMIRLMAIAYEDIYRRANNIYRVNVISASPMDPKDEQRLKQLVQDHLKGAKMEYSTSIDPDIIGGFVVNIDSERLDASIKNELKQLRQKLLSK